MRLIERWLHRSGGPSELARYQIELRVGLRLARVGFDGIARVADGAILNKDRINARVPAIVEAHASEPAPAFDRRHPAQPRNLEAVVGADILQHRLQVFSRERHVTRFPPGGMAFIESGISLPSAGAITAAAHAAQRPSARNQRIRRPPHSPATKAIHLGAGSAD